MEASCCQDGRGGEALTEKLYYSDGYLKECEAAVTGVTESGIILDRTIFYPEGGGQPGDRGTFGPYAIEDTVKADDGTPVHIIKGDKPSIGEKHLLSLDWEHRYFYMMEHTAQHLVSALLFSKHGIGTVAVHQGERFFTIETSASAIDDDTLLSAEDEANAAIRQNPSVYRRVMSHSEAEALGMRRSIKVASGSVMVVFIEGLDAVGCGGVHLASLGEIGEVQYCGQEKIRGHIRTMWKCGALSVAYRRQNRAITELLSSMLSSEPENAAEALRHLEDETAALRREVKSLSGKLAYCEYSQHRMGTEPGKAVIFSTDADIQAFESVLSPDDPSEAFIIDGNGRFMFHGTGEMFALLRSGLAAYSIHGGGRGMMYRGSVKGNPVDILENAGVLLNG